MISNIIPYHLRQPSELKIRGTLDRVLTLYITIPVSFPSGTLQLFLLSDVLLELVLKYLKWWVVVTTRRRRDHSTLLDSNVFTYMSGL